MDVAVLEEVSAALASVDVDAQFFDENEIWFMRFALEEFPGKLAPAFLYLDPGEDYFICMAPIQFARRLESLKAETVRRLVALNSAVRLAKLEYHPVPGGGLYYASSECSVDGFTGEKLRARLEAVATLAMRANTQLAR